ncbi:MAG: sigma-70 family RNA polymerase sigma factor, partial [Deltaproteobacteria bacterium]|nr:sigma-70 family RNA polymerase sigma factor [Deltaproteobacteria bacterium]
MSVEEKKVIALDDIHLAQKAQRDRKTAELILRRLQPKIFQVIRACVRSSPHAEEIGQAVALEVLKSLHTFRGEASLEAWAGGIAYRVSMKTLKKEREWELVHTTIDESAPASLTTPEKRASKQQLYASLLNKLQHLPSKRRTTLVLHVVHGYTVKEIS